MTIRTLITKRTNPTSILRKVAIIGGTHGNERAGVHMVQHFETNPEVVKRSTFETVCLLSNLEAIKADRRYVTVDLNRCFDKEFLDKALKTPVSERFYEMRRALEVDEAIGPKFSDSPIADMVFDLHNSTANTGVLLCFHKDDLFAREVAAFLKCFVDPEVCTVLWPQDDPPFLPSIGKSGMTVEVGPVAHSTVKAEIYMRTRKIVERALDYVELHNSYIKNPTDSSIKKISVKIPVAERVAQIDYPRDKDGHLIGFIHPTIQGIAELNPGSTVRNGSPIFQLASGADVNLDLEKLETYVPVEKTEELYPMFVNEAAYYEKGVAFYLTRIIERDVTILSRDSASKL